MMPDETSHDAICELLPWYVNETLDDSDRRRVAAHLSACKDGRDDVAALAAVQRALRSDGVEAIVPKTDPRALLAGVSRDGSAPRRRSRLVLPLVAAAAGIAATAIAFYALHRPAAPENQLFQTATSAADSSRADYILKVDFSESVWTTRRPTSSGSGSSSLTSQRSRTSKTGCGRYRASTRRPSWQSRSR